MKSFSCSLKDGHYYGKKDVWEHSIQWDKTFKNSSCVVKVWKSLFHSSTNIPSNPSVSHQVNSCQQNSLTGGGNDLYRCSMRGFIGLQCCVCMFCSGRLQVCCSWLMWEFVPTHVHIVHTHRWELVSQAAVQQWRFLRICAEVVWGPI